MIGSVQSQAVKIRLRRALHGSDSGQSRSSRRDIRVTIESDPSHRPLLKHASLESYAMGLSRSSLVCHGGCLSTDRYHNRAGRASDVPTQPGIVQSRSGHHKIIVTTLRSQTLYEPCLEGSRSPLPSVLYATSSSSPALAFCMRSNIQLSRRMRAPQLQDL